MSAAPTLDDLRSFVGRMLGWGRDRSIDLALRSIDLAANHHAALVVQGVEDLVPIAQSLHRRTLGADRPFVVCDPRRRVVDACVRSPKSCVSGVDAVAAAAGGTLCFRARRLPHDFAAAAKRLRDTDDVMLVICGDGAYPRDLLLVRPAPICVPAVARRASDLSRIIDEYARDAVAELAAGRTELTNADQSWVRQYAAASLGEVEKATLRLVAIRTSRNVSAAAARLGMAPVSLAKWLGRRQPLPAVRREP